MEKSISYWKQTVRLRNTTQMWQPRFGDIETDTVSRVLD